MTSILERLTSLFALEAIAERFAAFVPDLIVATISFLIFVAVWRLGRRALEPILVRDEHDHIAERHALREGLFGALNAAGINMPFETLKLQPIEVHEWGGDNDAGR